MKLISVNVSPPIDVPYRNGILRTGIYKKPVGGRVMLRQYNLDGDGQADLEAHGGTYKAAYVYPHEHYATWAAELERDDFAYGQFGENLTTEGLLETEVYIGDVFRIGEALVEVTQPRVPCFKLAYKMGTPAFVKQFLASGRSGFYLRVLEEGEIGAGDSIEKIKDGEGKMTVYEVNHLLYFDRDNIEAAQHAAQLPALSPGWRDSFEDIVTDA